MNLEDNSCLQDIIDKISRPWSFSFSFLFPHFLQKTILGLGKKDILYEILYKMYFYKNDIHLFIYSLIILKKRKEKKTGDMI